MARIDNLTNYLTDVASAIKTKKGDSTPILASNFDTEIANLPSGGVTSLEAKDVNFYDYDGTITNSYTKNEFLALSSMPDNPTHTGLTAQGWNWTLSDAQTYVTNNGALEIGQMYVTDDNKTRLYVSIVGLNRTPYVGLAINGSAIVNWGDESTSTITGTSTTQIVSVNHTYANEGDYVITIYSETNYLLQGYNDYTSTYYGGVTSGLINSNNAYTYHLNKVELASNVTVEARAFRNCRNLKSITIPSSLTTLGGYVIQYCENLKYLTIPTGITSFQQHCLDNNYLEAISFPKQTTYFGTYAVSSNASIKRLTLPSATSRYCVYYLGSLYKLIIPYGLTSISRDFCQYNDSLSEVKIPNTVTSMGNSCFYNNYNLKVVDCSTFSSVPTGGTAMFANAHTDLKIIVPDSLYETWKTTSNWSTYASNIVKASDV